MMPTNLEAAPERWRRGGRREIPTTYCPRLPRLHLQINAFRRNIRQFPTLPRLPPFIGCPQDFTSIAVASGQNRQNSVDHRKPQCYSRSIGQFMLILWSVSLARFVSKEELFSRSARHQSDRKPKTDEQGKRGHHAADAAVQQIRLQNR